MCECSFQDVARMRHVKDGKRTNEFYHLVDSYRQKILFTFSLHCSVQSSLYAVKEKKTFRRKLVCCFKVEERLSTQRNSAYFLCFSLAVPNSGCLCNSQDIHCQDNGWMNCSCMDFVELKCNWRFVGCIDSTHIPNLGWCFLQHRVVPTQLIVFKVFFFSDKGVQYLSRKCLSQYKCWEKQIAYLQCQARQLSVFLALHIQLELY